MIYTPDAQTAFEERESLVMGQGQFWYILRVYAGLPIKVAQVLNERGFRAYCPIETRRRQHPKGKEIFLHRKPLFPGYVFSDRHFPVELLNTTRTKVRWLMFDNRICYLTDKQMKQVRESETAWRPDFEDLLHALNQIARGAKPIKTKYVSFDDFKKMSQTKELAA